MSGDLFTLFGHIPGVWDYQSLLSTFPPEAVAVGVTAFTTDAGPVISDGIVWTPFGVVKPQPYTDDHVMILADITGVSLDKATAVTVTVPLAVSVSFPVGVIIPIEQHGSGQVSVAKGAPAINIRSRGGLLSLAGQYSVATLRNLGMDDWLLCGDLA